MGSYLYYVIQTDLVTGCISEVEEVLLLISNDASDPPIVYSDSVCFGDTAAILSADGVNIRWYSDDLLTDSVYFGNDFNTQQTAVGEYTYWATQENGCGQSPATSGTLTVMDAPDAPLASDVEICEGETAELTAIGTGLNWFADSLLTDLLLSGDTLLVADSLPGSYNFYVTQTNICESQPDTVSLLVSVAPVAPMVTDTTICEGSAFDGLVANGEGILWYNDPLLVNPIQTGDTLAIVANVPGVFQFYATQTINGCEGAADTVDFEIFDTPDAPIATDQFICFGETVPDLSATGSNVVWYSDSLLTSFGFSMVKFMQLEKQKLEHAHYYIIQAVHRMAV